MADFVQRVQGEVNKRYVIVHCEAGISRSAAIALFVEASAGCNFQKSDQASFANKLVVQTMSETAGVEIAIPEQAISAGGILIF